MALLDKIKGAVENLGQEIEAANAMDLRELADIMKQTKLLDPKMMAYKPVLKEKCHMLDENEIEEFYKEIEKAGSFFKAHPAKEVIEDVLVERRMYVRNDDGSISKNMAYKWFK